MSHTAARKQPVQGQWQDTMPETPCSCSCWASIEAGAPRVCRTPDLCRARRSVQREEPVSSVGPLVWPIVIVIATLAAAAFVRWY